MFILLSLLVVSCNINSKRKLEIENLKLRNENDNLRDSMRKKISMEYLEIFHNAKKAIADSIVFGITEQDLNTELCGWTQVVAYNFAHYAHINTQYNSNCGLIDWNVREGSKLKYTYPVKEYNENAKLITQDRQMSFIPKEKGMYYWKGQLEVKNPRTGMITSYPIYDSIYVLN